MADLTDYDVKVGDQTITFRGPSSMTDAEVKTRAQQEVAFKSGSIPTTFSEGAKRSAGETIADNANGIGTATSLAGVATAQPWLVAAGPLVGRGAQAIGESLANRPVTPTSTSELAGLAAEGAVAGYGPGMIGKGLDKFAASTVAHQLPSGQWVKGVSGHGVLPWAVRTAGEVAGAIGPQGATTLSNAGKATQAAVAVAINQAQAAMSQGVPPSKAAVDASGGSPSLFAAIMQHFMSGGGK